MSDSRAGFSHDVLRYDAWYRTAWGAYAEAEELRLLLEMARPHPGASALDVGCGTGRVLLRMLAEGLDARGVEPAPDMREVARLRLKCTGRGPDRVLNATAEELPLDDGTFDLVCAITVLEFVENVGQVLEEMARVCRGRIFLGALNARSIYGARILRGEAGETLSRANLQTPAGLTDLVRQHLRPRRIDLRTTLIGGLTDDPLELAVQRELDLRMRTERCALGGFIGLVAEVRR